MTLNRCSRCGDFLFSNRECNCKPFTIIDQDGDDCIVYAFDEHFAAKKWAQDSNEGNDYYLMGQTVEITVDGVPYSVSAEPDIYYSVHKKAKINGQT